MDGGRPDRAVRRQRTVPLRRRGRFPDVLVGLDELLRRRGVRAPTPPTHHGHGPDADAGRDRRAQAGQAVDLALRAHGDRLRDDAQQAGTTIAGTAALSADGQKLTFTPSSPLPADTDVTVDGLRASCRPRGRCCRRRPGPSAPSRRPRCLTSLFAGLTPAVPVGQRQPPGRARHGVHAVGRRHGDGDQVLQGQREHRDPHGLRLVVDRDPAGTVTFTSETRDRMADRTLATPVALTAGQTYVVSYFAPNGRYSGTPALLRQHLDLRPADGPGGNNGRYRYGAGGGFPTGSWNATNYFVDVVFRLARPTDCHGRSGRQLMHRTETKEGNGWKQTTPKPRGRSRGRRLLGPEPDPQLPAPARTGTWSPSATSTSTAPGRCSARGPASTSTPSLDEVLARDDVDAVAIATPARTHQGIALRGAAGRQARPGREAAGRQRRARAGDGRPGRASRVSC